MKPASLIPTGRKLVNVSEFFGVEEVRMSSIELWLPGDISFDQWQALGVHLRRLHRTCQWLLGDWINFGDNKFGEKYTQALEETEYDYGALRVMAHIASRYEVKDRFPSLTFSHHKIAASLPEKRRAAVLKRADENTWTTAQMREHLARKNAEPRSAKTKTCPTCGGTGRVDV